MELISGEISLEEFHPGAYIFFEEDLDYHFYIIDSGEVQIFTKDNDGKRINLATLGPGDSFGELAMIDRSPRSASAQALKFTQVYKISETGYQKLISELPDWTQAILKSFASRIRRMNDILKEQNMILRQIQSQDFTKF
jgi:CRP-like cAMP-binding protein